MNCRTAKKVSPEGQLFLIQNEQWGGSNFGGSALDSELRVDVAIIGKPGKT